MISKSQNFKQEYCCTIVCIGEVTPIDGSDFLGKEAELMDKGEVDMEMNDNY